jgi:hypothetical protein
MVKILKVKNNTPTVIEYEGRRYVLDMKIKAKKKGVPNEKKQN